MTSQQPSLSMSDTVVRVNAGGDTQQNGGASADTTDVSVAAVDRRPGFRAPWNEVHTALAIPATLGVSAVIAIGPAFDMTAQAIVMGVLVATIGLPHGAYDAEVGRRLLSPRLGRAWAAPFVGGYVLLACAAAALWIASPIVGLGLLLVGGAAHWGDDDLEVTPTRWPARLVLAASRGALPVTLPCVAHPNEVAMIFRWLGVDAATTSGVFTIALVATIIAAPGMLVSVAQAVSWRRVGERDGASMFSTYMPILEIVAIVSLMIAAAPLLAFTIYFCGWHALRHSIRSAMALDPRSPRRASWLYLRATTAPTVATILLAAPIGAYLLVADARLPAEAVAQITFIGLFALTVPHVLLDAWPAMFGSRTGGSDIAA